METTTPFTEFGLSAPLISSLSKMGFEKASPIQNMTLEHILEGKDIFAQAETGSGKTGSFAIPICEQLLREESPGEDEDKLVQYVTLSPTRELAQQTHKVFDQLGKHLGIHAACLIGGESIDKQKSILKKGTRVLVATPGRLVDLIKQKSVKLDQVKAVVFDEADRLFDMGFQKDIEFILSKVKEDRQLIMVSATSNMEVLKTAYKFKSHPMELKLNEDSILVDHINHSLAMITKEEKMPFLVNILRENSDVYAIVFCNTQMQTHLVAEWLRLMDFKAKPISGRLPQNKRTRLMEEFRNKEVTILVCTDVAARGLDIKDVNLVINYDLPQEAANYVHRIGRTGRAGKEGRAISFCAHEDCEHLDDIYAYIDSKIEKLEITDADVTAEIAPKPYIDGKTLQIVDRNRSSQRKDRSSRDTKRGNSREKRENKPMEKYDAPLERALPTPLKKFVPSEDDKRDRRFFVTTSESQEDADRAALGYYMITDESLLQREILSKGKKRYFFFGPQKITYRYSLEAHYKKLLLPFIIEILNLSHLDVKVKIAFKGDSLDISFNGKDEGLFLRNRGEMLQSLEQICRLYLANKITLPSKLKWNVRVQGARQGSDRDKDRERGRKQDGRNNSRGRDNRRGGRTSDKDQKAREEKIIALAEEAKNKVLNSKEPFTMKPLDPRDRRIVHQHLGEDDVVKTTSLGDGRLKKIEVSLR